MANQFVSKDGSDSNNGTTWALAKKTISAAATAAGNLESVTVASGVYVENIPGANRRYYGVGRVVIDGSGGECIGGINGGEINDFIFQNFSRAINTIASGSLSLSRCEFHGGGVGNGIRLVSLGPGGICRNLLFVNCLSGVISEGVVSSGTLLFERCTFADCGDGLKSIAPPGNWGPFAFSHCLFYNNTRHFGAVAQAGSNHNLYWPLDATHKVVLVSGSTAVDITTMEAMRNHVGRGNDLDSVSVNPLLLDPTNGMYLFGYSSPAATSGRSGSFVGAFPPATGISDGSNPTVFHAPASSTGLVQVGAGWQLAVGSTTGTYRSQVLDLGAIRQPRRIKIFGDIVAPAEVFDHSITDAAPRQWTFRYRYSASLFTNADALPSWIEAPLESNIFAPARYLQVEVPLRNNGPV